MTARFLVVDDDPVYARTLRRTLERGGHEVTTVGTAQEARERFDAASPEVVILDYQLPDANGLELLEELRPKATGAVFLLNTAYPDLSLAVDAIRRGAFDYVAKDLEPAEWTMRIERAVDVAHLRRRVVEAGATSGGDGGMLGESATMRRLRSRLDALAKSDDTTAFIVGETGTGKGVIARLVHAKSGRAYEPFVAVDCTTIPATLVESELFGHEKGAFSGATHSKTGRVEAAGQGTLFLDEIGELELPMQAKLLRLLEEREFTRVGSTKPRKLVARIIAATNRDLSRAVAEGRFRADLRYRLEVFVVEVPPLRERGDDIFLLATHFAQERARTLGRDEPSFDAEVLEAMSRYPFPGNVRELRNMVEQAVLLSPGDTITLEAFPVLTKVAAGWEPPRAVYAGAPPHESAPPGPSLGLGPSSQPPLGQMVGQGAAPSAPPSHAAPYASGDQPARPRTAPQDLESIREAHATQERQRLLDALEATGGNVSAAARQLGLSRYQVLRRLTKYGLR
ncbi:MAG: sigma-54 dependent transcriptional regulator [Sandaracinaceae bacterium]